jgi:hypothetical protein
MFFLPDAGTAYLNGPTLAVVGNIVADELWAVRNVNIFDGGFNINGQTLAQVLADASVKQSENATTASGASLFYYQTGITDAGGYVEGKIYYDEEWKTLSLYGGTSGDIKLQIGQETVAYVYNGTGSPITQGKVVYIAWATASGYPSIALADNTAEATSFALGVVTTASISVGGYGYVTIRGHVHDLDTSSFSVGDSLYLGTAGALTNVAPSAGAFDVRIGRVMIKDSTAGAIYVNVRPMSKLTDLSDVTITNPVTDQVLRYNGVEWVNGNATTTSGGAGIAWYFDGTQIIGTGNDNANRVETLSKTPWIHSEDVETAVVNNNTVLSDIYLYDSALNRTSLTSGEWVFNLYAAVSSSSGTTEILHNVVRARPGAGTVTVTDTGTTRTVTASTGSPFAAALVDVGGTIDSDSYLRTPKGVYRILSTNGSNSITISTPSTYTNESTVAFSVHKRLFQVTTGEINNTATSPAFAGLQLYTVRSVQPEYTIEAADKLAMYRFSKTTRTSNTDTYLSYGGTTRYSFATSPLAVLHNNLPSLQGGASDQYYHANLKEYEQLQTLNRAYDGGLPTTATALNGAVISCLGLDGGQNDVGANCGAAGQVAMSAGPGMAAYWGAAASANETIRTVALSGSAPNGETGLITDQIVVIPSLDGGNAVYNLFPVAASTEGKAVTFKWSGTGYLYIVGNDGGQEKIDGDPSLSIVASKAGVKLVSYDGGWIVVGGFTY